MNQAFIEQHFDFVREMCKGDYSFIIRDKRDDIPAGCLYSCLEMVRWNEWNHWLFIVEEHFRGKLSDSVLNEADSTWDLNSKDYLKAKQEIALKKRPIQSPKQFSDIIFEFEHQI